MKIRCINTYNPKNKIWVAMSLEFGLAAQAENRQEANQKLEAQIQEYIDDAFGINQSHQKELLNRKAPLSIYILYYWLSLKSMISNNKSYFFYNSIHDAASHA